MNDAFIKLFGENKKKEKKEVSLSVEHRAVYVSNRLGRWFSSLSFLCSPASLAITAWMEYSLEEFVSPVNATAMQLSVIFKAFAL